MRVVVCAFLVICCFFQTFATNLPSFIHPCSLSDPKLEECIEKAIEWAGPKFADGIPELGIAPLDPVQLGTLHVDNPALNLVFNNTSVTGLRNFRLNSYKMNNDKGKAILDFTANVTLKGNYDMDGQILILAIKGNGQARIKITNLNIVIKYDYDTRNGHWVVTGYKDSYKMDRAQFKFTNLFGGNKQLADTTNQFINQNWQMIMQEIAPPAIKTIIKKCVNEVRKFLISFPADQILKE